MTDTPKIYLCDPDKNVDCKGRHENGWCGTECYMTTHEEFAKNDSNGKAFVVSNVISISDPALEVGERGDSEGSVS